MEKGPCGALTQNTNLILSKHWKNSLFPQHLHFILHQRHHPGRWSCHPSRTRCSRWHRVLKCCYLLPPESRVWVGLRWDQLGEMGRSSELRIPRQHIWGVFKFHINCGRESLKEKGQGCAGCFLEIPNFCKEGGQSWELGQNPLSSTVHQDSCCGGGGCLLL